MLTKVLLTFFYLLILISPVFAQTNEAGKIDEFGNTNCDDYIGRIDYLLVALRNSPETKGYVFIYEGNLQQFVYDRNGKNKGIKYVLSERGFAKEVINYFKNHLLFRRFPAERIDFVSGGFREKFTVELWFAPKGASPPQPTPTLKKIKQTNPKPNKFGFCGEM